MLSQYPVASTTARRFFWAGIAVLVVAVAAGCYPGGPTDLSELDTVVTVYDKDYDFTKPRTYAMSDSVAHLGDPSDPSYVELDTTYDDLILLTIEAEMTAYGWTREMAPETNGADLFVLPSAVGATTWVLYSYYPSYPYWGWYPGWGYYPAYGPGWGWGYPEYYTATSYSTGTIFIDMVDPSAADPNTTTMPARWTAALSGLLGASSTPTSDRITRAIDQAFTQSPYLKRN